MSIKSNLRRPRTWFIAVPLVGLLAAVGGPWAYINVIKDDPPAELSFADIAAPASTPTAAASASPSTTAAVASSTASTGSTSETTANPSTTTAAATSDSMIEGSWTIASGSQAGYRVPEVLFGQDTEGVGRTSDVSGSLTIDGTSITATQIEVDLTTVASDSSQRDNQFRNRIMETPSS